MEVLKRQGLFTGLLLLLAVLIAFDVYQTGIGNILDGFGRALNVRVESNVPRMGRVELAMEDLIRLRIEPTRAASEIASPEVTLYWEPVPNAAYYRIGVSPGSVSDLIRGDAVIRPFAETTDYEVRIRLDELRWTWWERQYDGALISPTTLLGAIIPGERLLIVVDAYSDEGDLIGSSVIIERGGYAMAAHVWHIATDGSTGLAWSAEARAILEGRYEEALLGLQRRLAQNPYDEEALHILFRAYYFGIDRTRRYQNPELAVFYGTRLLEVLPPGDVREGYLQRTYEMANKANIAWIAPDGGVGQEGE